MIVFNSLLKQGLLSIDENTLAFENGKLTAKISMGAYTEVETLPSIAEAKEGVTYLVPTGDYFTMYVVDKTNGKWINLGTTSSKTYEFGDGLVENGGVVTLDEKPKAIRDYFVNVDQWGAVVPYLAIQDTLDVAGDIATESALKGESLEIGSTIGADATGLYDTRTSYPEDGKYVVTKYLLEERIKDLTLSVPTNVSQLNNDKNYATLTQVTGLLNQGINLMVAKSGSTMTGALTINNDLKALPLGYTTSMGVPAYGLQVSSTYGLQLFGTHFLNGTLWGEDGLKIVNNNLSLTTLDEAFISSDYANTTTFRAMPNDGTQATYQFQGWGWDDDSHTTKSPRLGVRLLKPNQATAIEMESVLNVSEGDNRWVSLSGGTMTGYLNIPSPTSSSHPTTKSYVDNLFASGGGGGGLQNKATGTASLSILGAATASNYSVCVGTSANAFNHYSVSVGYESHSLGDSSVAIGRSSSANGISSVAIGQKAKTTASYSIAIGREATSNDSGVTVISAWNNSGNAKTQLKIIGKGSTPSTNKLGGKSGIEYEEYNSSGTITNSGAISFEALVSGGGGGGGLQNNATGNGSLSILGAATTSIGSISVGYSANASQRNAIAVGVEATASSPDTTVVGVGATASGRYATALGEYASATAASSTALGIRASASGAGSIALGVSASATAMGSTALGSLANASDNGVMVLSAANDDGTAKTQLYLIGAGSTMSTTYCDGEAGLGFMCKDSSGEIIKRGTIKLSALCTENTDTFEPSGW